MAELPQTMSTADFSWQATTGGTSEPGGTKRTDGWLDEEEPPHQEFNWWWQKMGALIDHLRTIAVRRFDNLPDAIDGCTQYDTFFLQHVTKWPTNAADARSTTYAPAKLACDGRNFYYTSSQRVVAQRSIPSGGIADDWVWDASVDGGIDAERLDTDGSIVGVANNTGGGAPRISVASNGVMVYEDPDSEKCYAVVCDTYASSVRVWWGTYPAAGTATIYVRTTGARSSAVTGLEPVQAICVTDNFVIVGHGDTTDAKLQLYKKASATTLTADKSYILTGYPQTRAQALCADGDTIYWAVDGVGGSAGATVRAIQWDAYGVAVVLWSKEVPTFNAFGSGLKVLVDDRYLYMRWKNGAGDVGVCIINKRTGNIVQFVVQTGITDFAIDGQHLLIATASGLNYFGTGRNAGLWHRRFTEDSNTPMRALAIPAGGR